jgi:hypothetical protein
MVPSTGKFPPTPKPIRAMKTQRAEKEGDAPETSPKIPPMTRVAFHAIRRLGVSHRGGGAETVEEL